MLAQTMIWPKRPRGVVIRILVEDVYHDAAVSSLVLPKVFFVNENVVGQYEIVVRVANVRT